MKLRDADLPNDIKTLQTMLLAERQLSASQEQHISDNEQLIEQLQQQLIPFPKFNYAIKWSIFYCINWLTFRLHFSIYSMHHNML